MAFGKRKTPPGGGDIKLAISAPPPSIEPGPYEERLTALRGIMDRCLTQAAELAGSIERMEMLDASRFGPATRNDQYPIDISDMAACFSWGSGSDRRHAVFAFAFPEGPNGPQIAAALDTCDTRAQLALLDLATEIVRINTTCRTASLDGVLGVAIQSPAMRQSVDRVIVPAAFFSGFFEAMLIAQPAPGTSSTPVDLERLRHAIERRLAVARRAMLAPEQFEELVPAKRWPLVGLELGCRDHEGQRFVNEVYLPKELAEPVMATLAGMQTEAMAAATG